MALDRRDFMVKSSTFGLGLALSPSLIQQAKRDYRSITILHTNDTHSQIDPFPDNHKYHAQKGGVVNRAKMVEKIRQEAPNALLLDAGDVFQGTPYFNRFHGHLEMQVMQTMGYDAMTMGNHDFDIGIEGFEKAYRANASFPIISSNYDFTDTSIGDLVLPFKIFERNEIRIGVFGLGIELKGLVSKAMYGDTRYNDPIAAATKYTKLLKKELKCDLVICLSHLGYKYDTEKVSDRILAQTVEGIDLIIGGHTHSFLSKPELITREKSGATLVNQVGFGGINLGRIDFILGDGKLKKIHNLIEVV
jgi:5'-nucleotidase